MHALMQIRVYPYLQMAPAAQPGFPFLWKVVCYGKLQSQNARRVRRRADFPVHNAPQAVQPAAPSGMTGYVKGCPVAAAVTGPN